MRKFSATPYLYTFPVILILLGMVAYPLINSLWISMTDKVIAGSGTFVGLKNFITLFQDPNYRIAFGNSIYLTFVAVLGKFVLGLLGAVLLIQKFPLRSLARTLVFLPWAVPGLIAGLSWRWLYNEQNGVLNHILMSMGLTNTFVYWLSDPKIGMVSIIIATIWHGLPFYIMMFLAGMSAIPSELYEAAVVDGSNAWQSFWNITLPSLKDQIVIVLMLSSIWTFNSFHMVFILTGGGPAYKTHILPTLAYDYAIRRNQLGLGSAVMVSVIPLFLVFIYFLTRRMLQDRST